MYSSPIHLVRQRPPGEVVITPSLRVNDRRALHLLTRDPGHDDGDDADERLDWVLPRIQGGLALDLASSANTALSAALSVSDTQSGLSWALDGSIARIWMAPDGLGFRLDLGLRTRRSEYEVIYVGFDPSATIPQIVSGSRWHRDPYATLTVNALPGDEAFNAHLVFEAGFATYLDFPLRIGSTWSDIDRRGGMLGLSVGMSRQLGSSRRLLGGLRYALVNDDDGVVQLYTQMDFLFNRVNQ